MPDRLCAEGTTITSAGPDPEPEPEPITDREPVWRLPGADGTGNIVPRAERVPVGATLCLEAVPAKMGMTFDAPENKPPPERIPPEWRLGDIIDLDPSTTGTLCLEGDITVWWVEGATDSITDRGADATTTGV